MEAGDKGNGKFHCVAPSVPGIRRIPGGIRFNVVTEEDEAAALWIYKKGEPKPLWTIDLPEEERIGTAIAVEVELPDTVLSDRSLEYTYRIGNKEICDPYAQAVTKKDDRDRAQILDIVPSKTASIFIPYEDMILYKLGIRSFTRDSSSQVQNPGTFEGLIEKIPHLKQLGITSLLLMPVYEFEEQVEIPSTYRISKEIEILDGSAAKEKKNLWGYASGYYFAVKSSYAADERADQSFARMVDSLHQAGIEVLLEFYFDQDTQESLIREVLHFWLLHFHVDGFRVIGDESHYKALARDPFLKKTKLIFTDPFLADSEGKMKGGARTLSSLNVGYEQNMRRFLKGDEDVDLSAVQWNLRRNSDSSAFINYFADQDGFTMADMVAYEHRRNEENGENNTDGTRNNYSWNCGEEGPSSRPEVLRLRKNQLHNAFLMLFLSQGVPMLYAGDEFLNSQKGNNNAWCQDNPVGWVNWHNSAEAVDLQEMIAALISFRKVNRILHQQRLLRLSDYHSTGCPELSIHTSLAWAETDDKTRIGFALLFNGKYAKETVQKESGRKSRREKYRGEQKSLSEQTKSQEKEEEYLYLIFNMYWKPQEFALPDLPEGNVWMEAADSLAEGVFHKRKKDLESIDPEKKKIRIDARSIRILTSAPKRKKPLRRKLRNRKNECKETFSKDDETSKE